MITVTEVPLWLSHQSIRHSKLAQNDIVLYCDVYLRKIVSEFSIYVVKLQTIDLPHMDQGRLTHCDGLVIALS